jgi:hypothetical protein
MRDLEIRGAGNILGAQQHGHMEAVGYDMYLKMLEQAVSEEKGESPPVSEKECLIDLPIDAHIPADYIENVPHKLKMYRRIADIKNQDVRQQIKDADKWLQNVNILRDGMEGLYTENPGNFKSQTLNQITASISNVYQKVKDRMNKRNAKLR